MRYDAENRLHDLIRDNKQFIKDFTEDGNIYQYLIADLNAWDGQLSLYLTHDELEAYFDNEIDQIDLINEIYQLIEKYNYPVDQFPR